MRGSVGMRGQNAWHRAREKSVADLVLAHLLLMFLMVHREAAPVWIERVEVQKQPWGTVLVYVLCPLVANGVAAKICRDRKPLTRLGVVEAQMLQSAGSLDFPLAPLLLGRSMDLFLKVLSLLHGSILLIQSLARLILSSLGKLGPNFQLVTLYHCPYLPLRKRLLLLFFLPMEFIRQLQIPSHIFRTLERLLPMHHKLAKLVGVSFRVLVFPLPLRTIGQQILCRVEDHRLRR